MSRFINALPDGVKRELYNVAASRVDGMNSFSEIHITLGNNSSVLSHNERIFLKTAVSRTEMGEILLKLCGGAIYAHRDTIRNGYVCAEDGIRVGVVGTAKYDGDVMVGVGDVSSLIFRMPTGRSSLAEELYCAFSKCRSGMLIYSRAGVGKTTAIRTLAEEIAVRNKGTRVTVVDERCEFSSDACAKYGIVHLRGYRRVDGIDIALRTLSSDVIIVDEISTREETLSFRSSLNTGFKLVATAHADNAENAKKRAVVRELADSGAIDVLFGVFNTAGSYEYRVEELLS